MELISRVVGGWNVRLLVKGKRISRFFADSKSGGKRNALETAKAYRDEMLASRPVTKKKPRPLLVTRGTGQSVQIRLPKSKGRGTTTTEFSVQKYGPKKAKAMAIQAWTDAMAMVK